jgi:pimeloyl-ACP methyl ester carboxylesterase
MGDFVLRLAAHFGIERMHAVGPDVGTLALLFAAVRKPELFISMIVGSGATSTELAGGGLKDLIGSPAGYFAKVEGGDIAVQFVTDSACVFR